MGYGSLRATRSLLPLYYYGTLPLRRLAWSALTWASRCPVIVLFYHRVADHVPNPWTISNRDFVCQVEWLSSRFELISLPVAQERLASGRNPRPAVSITFDDGYADNCDQALPYLISRGVPFTYFVATDFVLKNRPFPHDTQRGQPLRPNTVEQLRNLAAAGVEIGAHSRTHLDLGKSCSPAIVHDEVVGSRNDLQNMLGIPVRYFAVPFGQYANLSPAVFQIARDAGLAGICSAYGGYNFPGIDPFHLQRVHGDPDSLRFRNWLSFDFRVAAGVRRFSYDFPIPDLSREDRASPAHEPTQVPAEE